jgi:hypothetical protein
MQVNDIVVIYRVHNNGLVTRSAAIKSKLELWMIENEEKYLQEVKKCKNGKEIDLNEVLQYFEGCLFVSDSENPEVARLLDNISNELIAIDDLLTPKDYSRITQALVATNMQINCEPLKQLLTKYLQKNIDDPSLNRDIRLNLARIV